VDNILEIVGDGSIGGGTTAVLNLAVGLADRGVSVAIATQRDSYLAAEAQAAGLRTLGLDFGRRRNTLRLAHALGQSLEEIGGGVVHAHGARAGLPAALIPRSRRTAFVYTVHGFHYANKPFGIRQVARSVERFCMFAVSNYETD
jgi:hypothetical protein